MEENSQPAAPQQAPKMIEQRIFNGLLNRLLFNTGFYVASSLKEKPKFDGDVSVYLVNVIVNNSVINVNSELMAILDANCHIVQVSNDARYPNQILIGCEIYVAPQAPATATAIPAPAEVTN